MKKLLLPLLLISVLAMAGCQKKETKKLSWEEKYAEERKIEDYINRYTFANDKMFVQDDDWVRAYMHDDGRMEVFIRVEEPYYIPYVAEAMGPIAKEALDRYGIELKQFEVNSYKKENDEIVHGTLVNWATDDWEKGVFNDSTNGDNKFTNATIKNATIQDMKDYYAEYDSIVQDIINGK